MATSPSHNSPANLVRIGWALMGLGALGAFYLIIYPPAYDPIYGAADIQSHRQMMYLALGTWLAGVSLQFRAWWASTRNR